MLQGSSVKRVLLQVAAVAAYFAVVAILYWQWLWNAGAAAIIVGLLFLFKAVVDSGAISIAHLSPLELGFNIRPPEIELFKSISFFGVGVGVWVDLADAVHAGLVPGTLPTVVIHFMVVCIFAMCVACCMARYLALSNRTRR